VQYKENPALSAEFEAPDEPDFPAPAAPARVVIPVASAPAQVAAPAPTPAPSLAPVVSLRGLPTAFSEFKEALEISTVESLGIGSFSRVTTDTGGFLLDKEEVGSTLRLALYSWNDRYLITTGSQGEEAKKRAAISYDGVTISGTREPVQDVLQAMRDDGYTQAAVKLYVDLWGQLIYARGKDLPIAEQKFVQVQLSPESVKKWKAFQVETSFKIARGQVQPSEVITLEAKRGDWKGNRFGYCVFSL
jgi:hypothetical protein